MNECYQTILRTITQLPCIFQSTAWCRKTKQNKNTNSLLTQPLAGEVLSAQLCLSSRGGSCPLWLLWCSIIAERFGDDWKYIIHGCVFLPSPWKAPKRDWEALTSIPKEPESTCPSQRAYCQSVDPGHPSTRSYKWEP